MSILKAYSEMHPTSFFFFSHLKKHKTCHCKMFRMFSKDHIFISNVFSVSAYNTLTTKRIVKKVCSKNKCHFCHNKKFRLPISIPTCSTECFYLSPCFI